MSNVNDGFVEIGKDGRGRPVYGTLRQLCDHYRMAADAEAKEVDRLNYELSRAVEQKKQADHRYLNLVLDLGRVLRGEPTLNSFEIVEEIKAALQEGSNE